MAAQEAGDEAGSAALEAREKGKEVVLRVQQQVQEQTEQVRGEVSDRVRQELDRRSTELGGGARSFAQALRRAGDELEGDEQPGTARFVRQVADRVERMGGYLIDSDGERILGDFEGQTRRRPWVGAAAGALAGFFASRLVKASSSRRYEQRRLSGQGSAGSVAPGGYQPASYPEERAGAGEGAL